MTSGTSTATEAHITLWNATPGEGTGREEPIVIREEGFEKQHFLLPSQYEASIDRVLIPHGLIEDRTEKLAWQIYRRYQGEELNVLCILKGSRGFFNDLIGYLNRIHTYNESSSDLPAFLEHYVRIQSYHNTESTGEISMSCGDLSPLVGKHVLIVEDIIDTGHTLKNFIAHLNKTAKPKTVAVASLLEKRTPKSNGFKGDFVGFSIPDAFVVGFSLDYNELFRDLNHICVLNKFGQQKFAL